jgi:ADP-heptose:LPS heptosyltransferase
VPGEHLREILVVDFQGGIGDLLMALPAVHALARRHPDARVRVLTDQPGADLLRADPAVAEVLVPAVPGQQVEAVEAVLRQRRPDLAVTTSRIGGIPDLLARGSERVVDDLWRRPPPDEPVGQRYLRILHEEGLVDEGDLGAAPRVVLTAAERRGARAVVRGVLGEAATSRPPVVLVTASGMRVKQWPATAWQQLARTLAGDGYPVVAVTPADAPSLPGVPALPALPLREVAACFAALAERGGVAVGGDTGPHRLAAACGLRTVGLFGPTSAARYGVPGATSLQGLPGCPHRRPTSITEQVCWWHADCPLSSTGPACMQAIEPRDVVRAVGAA